jgi:hypothetical protein
MNAHFEYFDFTPRKEFDEKANQILNDLRTHISLDCECEARCTYFANKFFFQITFRSESFTFSAQSILDPKKEDIKIRGWQLKAIENMSITLTNQLIKFKGSMASLKSA